MREQTSLEDRLGSLAKIGANSTKRRRSLNSAKPRATREPRPAQFDQSFPVALAWGAHGPQHAVGLERNDRMSAPTPPIWDHAPRRSRARCLSSHGPGDQRILADVPPLDGWRNVEVTDYPHRRRLRPRIEALGRSAFPRRRTRCAFPPTPHKSSSSKKSQRSFAPPARRKLRIALRAQAWSRLILRTRPLASHCRQSKSPPAKPRHG